MRKAVWITCALLLCTGLALAGGPPTGQKTDRAHAVSPPPPAPGPVTENIKDAALPGYGASNSTTEDKGDQGDKDKLAQEKPEPPPAEAASVSPFDFGNEGLDRGPCVGNVDINGAGTTGFTYMLNAYWASRRVSTIYTAAEFNCTGGQISGISYYVGTAPTSGYPLVNFQIAMRHTTLANYTSPFCFTPFPADWTIVYTNASQTITGTGWKTFTFTTPFVYDGVSNVEVDVSWGKIPSDSGNTGSIYSYTSGTSTVPRTIYGYTDSVTALPPTWGCAVTSLYIYGSATSPRAQFVFPPPSTGACCVNYVCVATNQQAECTALGGTWYGGSDCSTFYCPPWNDNCTAVTPTVLTAGVPATFTGTNLGATNDCASFSGGQVWEAFTLPAGASFFDVYLDYCTTTPAFGNSWLNLAIGCPCSSVSAAATYDTTTCGDGNVTMKWSGLAAGTYYYPVMLDAANNAAGTYVIHVVAMPSYCSSYATSTADENIQDFVLPASGGGIDHHNPTTAWCDTYNNFTAESASIQRGSTYAFSLSIGDCEGASCYSKRARIFIDWNQDYDFADAGETAWSSGQLTNSPCPVLTVTGNIIVPVDAVLGATRLRVVVVETSSTDPSACGTYTWGATEDYTVVIEPAPPTGACCFGVTCEDTGTWSEAACIAAGGRYMGDGSTCTPNPCFGACCLTNGSCEETQTAADCVALGGNFHGTGTTCAGTTCPQPGVNCDNPAVITLSLATLPFQELGATNCGFIDDYTASSSSTCMYYYTSGEDKLYKVIVEEAMDVTITLDPKTTTYAGIGIGYSCPPYNNCIAAAYSSSATPKVIGALPNCLHLEPGTYYIMVDTWSTPDCIPAYDLTITHCVVPTGACCVGETCSILTAAACATAGGAYIGDGTLCDPNPCLARACCLPGGICQDLSESDCTTAGGTWHSTAFCASTLCNDNCADATLIASGTPAATGNDCAATDDGSATCQTNSHKDVWYKWVADCTGTVTMDTEGSTTLTDTVLSVYDACGGTQIACDDDSGTGTLSKLSFNCITGVTYWIRVAAYSTGCGDFHLNIVCVPAPQGACCMPDGTCHLDYQTTCAGVFGGDGTACSGLDCNNNGVDDFCDIKSGVEHDCNNNGIPDSCDIAAGAPDVDGNGVPDECDPDCNGNGIPDACELPGGCATGDCGTVYPDACGTALDCQPDGIPDECQLGGGKSRVCTDMVYNAGECDGVNGTSPTAGWANNGLVDKFTVPQAGGPLTFACAHVVILGGSAYTNPPSMRIRMYALPTGSITTDLASFAAATALFDHEYTTASGELVISTHAECYPGAPAYSFDASGPAYTFAAGSYAIFVNFPGYTTSGAVYWASAADEGMGSAYVWGVDVNAPSTASMALAWNIMGGGGGGGGADCNENGIPDDCDIASGTSHDCNNNTIPDECDIASGHSQDCNRNGIPDECDIASGFSQDCNGNGIPDECDINAGTSQDCQPDGIPDECQLGTGGGSALSEGFDDITNLPGWYMQNNSSPVGSTTWFQGNSTVFTAQSGAATSYIGANFNSVYLSGTISTWLLTPPVELANGQTFDFYTRGPTCTTCYADRLQVRMSLNGTSTNVGTSATDVGDFATLLLDINPTYVANGYPQTWDAGHNTITLSGLAAPTQGRLAFRYFVENGGYYGVNSNYIGIDTVTLSGGGCPSNDCNCNNIPDECDILSGYSHDYNHNGVPDECEMCGDLNGDQLVNMADYWIFVDAFGTCVGDVKYNAACDFDGDGCITLVDYQDWVLCYRMANGKTFVAPKVVPGQPQSDKPAAPGKPVSGPQGRATQQAPLP